MAASFLRLNSTCSTPLRKILINRTFTTSAPLSAHSKTSLSRFNPYSSSFRGSNAQRLSLQIAASGVLLFAIYHSIPVRIFSYFRLFSHTYHDKIDQRNCDKPTEFQTHNFKWSYLCQPTGPSTSHRRTEINVPCPRLCRYRCTRLNHLRLI